MRKPLTEHDATLRSPRKDGPIPDAEDGRPLQPVEGGRVRRIVFRGDDDAPEGSDAPAAPPMDEAPEAPAPGPAASPGSNRYASRDESRHESRYESRYETHRTYRPRRAMSIEEIERAVDRMPRSPGRPFEPTLSTRRERVVYETPQGAVRRSDYTVSEGERRAIYISRRDGGYERERRFTGLEVDRLIADVPDRRVEVVRETVTENLAGGRADRTDRMAERAMDGPTNGSEALLEHEPPRPMRKKQRRRNGRSVVAVPPPTAVMLGPVQCRAVTADGKQCRNTARIGNEFCASHRDYTPPTIAQLRRRLDTAPRVKGAPDTLPGRGVRRGSTPTDGYQAQCVALTADGRQCRNSARGGSRFCGAHRNHRADAVRSRLDTAPRNPRAKDTTPKVRPTRSPAKGTAARKAAGGRKTGAARGGRGAAARGGSRKAGKTRRR